MQDAVVAPGLAVDYLTQSRNPSAMDLTIIEPLGKMAIISGVQV